MYQIWRILVLAAVYKAATASAAVAEVTTSPHTVESVLPNVEVLANVTDSHIRSPGALFPLMFGPIIDEPSVMWNRAHEGDTIDNLILNMGQPRRPITPATVHQSDLTTHSTPTRVEAFRNDARYASPTLDVPESTSIQSKLVPRRLMVAATAGSTAVHTVVGIDTHPAGVLPV